MCISQQAAAPFDTFTGCSSSLHVFFVRKWGFLVFVACESIKNGFPRVGLGHIGFFQSGTGPSDRTEAQELARSCSWVEILSA